MEDVNVNTVVNVMIREVEDDVTIENVTTVELDGDFIKFKRGSDIVAAFGLGYVVGFTCEEDGTLSWQTKT